MRLAGTDDRGWVVIDLRDVADAIASVRATAVAQRLRAQQERERQERAERSAAR